ncbi:hypothetical protein BOX15_Mlig024570g1 [Macrostomum lignano]|uniref:Uncharacterized protein n=1 Tax=Macrostomum lignano TaxID=282301 RepID=A0A267DEU6_9PLAT|nr:hypothetical protein BOX15_Mlig024570g2 [Macrostomum lignano]PAA47227.1 hypothetical protein BOX15_Mlig024570g1 [Macrostomum lignano]
MVRISVIDVNRRQPGEAIVSGTSTNEAVTRTPHRAAAMVSRPLNADRHSTSGRNQRSYASDKRDSEMMPRSGSGTPLSYLAARRQPIEEPIDNRNSATVREDVQAGQAHEIYSNSSIRPAAAPAPRGSTATSQRASAVPQSASAVPPPRASAVSQSASAVPPPRASASATSAVPSPRASSTTSPRASAVPSSRGPATRPRRASAASLPKASAVPQQVAVQSSASRPSTNPNTRAPAPSMANAAVPSSKVATTASSFAVRQLGRQSRTTTEV